MANACQSIGLVLAFMSVVGIIYTLASKEWKRNSQVSSGNQFVGTNSYEGLWIRCYSPVPGQIQCDQFDQSYLGLPAELQAQRAMMVIATIFAVFGVISAIVGMDCVSVMEGTRGKVWTGRTGGGMMIIAGILTIACVSWYAAGVASDYHYQSNVPNNNFGGYVYEFGSALYVGWISGGLAIISGILLTCCNCGGNDKDDYTYSYKPPHSNKPIAGKTAEYV